MARNFVLTITDTYFDCSCGELRLGFTKEAVASAAETHSADHIAAGDQPAICPKCGELADSGYWTAKCG